MRANLKLSSLATLAMILLGAGTAPAQERIKELSGSPDNPLTPLDRAFESASEEGDFRVTWPSGCNGLRTRTPTEAEPGSGQERPVIVYCDRHGEKGEGCSVTAIFNARDRDGAPTGPQDVMARLQAMLSNLGAEITRQSPVGKEFPDGRLIEGVDVLAAQTGGAGQVWLRGLLSGDTIYILAAWDLGGNLWSNPEYATFFSSFQPGVR